MSSTIRFLAPALALFAGACSTSRWYDYHFFPAPLEAQIEPQNDPKAQVRGLVSVLGVARAREGWPDAVEVRLRFENLGSQPAQLVAESLSLVSADLEPFGQPAITPPEPLAIPPAGNATFDVSFPLPHGKRPSDFNLRGLNLRWTLDFSGREVTTGASFQRDEWIGDYDEPRVHFGFGVGYTHVD